MMGFLVRRLAAAVLILIGVAFLTYLLLFVLPADPAKQIAGQRATPQILESIRAQLGLDQPFIVQFGQYLGRLLQGDLGRSYVQRAAVADLIWSRLPASLLLLISGIVVEVLLGLTLGILAAVNRNGPVDRGLMLLAFAGVSTPQFVAAILLLFVFAAGLGWLPLGGYGSLKHLVLPALTLGLLGAGWYARMVRSSLVEALGQDYVRTARAKGLPEWRVVLGHALPNAMLPVIAMIGIDIGQMLAGLVVIESVFRWPGIGQLAFQAITRVDIPVIMGVTLLSACFIVLGNLLADLVAPLADPRIRRS